MVEWLFFVCFYLVFFWFVCRVGGNLFGFYLGFGEVKVVLDLGWLVLFDCRMERFLCWEFFFFGKLGWLLLLVWVLGLLYVGYEVLVFFEFWGVWFLGRRL